MRKCHLPIDEFIVQCTEIPFAPWSVYCALHWNSVYPLISVLCNALKIVFTSWSAYQNLRSSSMGLSFAHQKDGVFLVFLDVVSLPNWTTSVYSFTFASCSISIFNICTPNISPSHIKTTQKKRIGWKYGMDFCRVLHYDRWVSLELYSMTWASVEFYSMTWASVEFYGLTWASLELYRIMDTVRRRTVTGLKWSQFANSLSR